MVDTDKQLIRLGHSPDPDDAFMFHGLACGAVDAGDFEFEHILRDIQTLNDWAKEGRLEITAVSVHAYAYVQDKYKILSAGASMGATELAEYVHNDGQIEEPTPQKTAKVTAHGPLLVAAKQIPLNELAGKIIAVPGTMTSAFLTLQLAIGKFDYKVMPFDEILDAVKRGDVDAGLIIHEGQLTYGRYGLCCLLDMGQWWYDNTKLPLPLGCNVIRRDLGDEKIRQISAILTDSIEYGLANRKKALEYAMQYGRGIEVETADHFVGMYVNRWTLDYGPAGRKAVGELLARGANAGLVPKIQPLEFV